MPTDRSPNPNRPEGPEPENRGHGSHGPGGQGPDDLDEQERAVVGMLLEAYGRGLFPMAEPGGEIYLYDPDPRGIIPLEDGGLVVPRSLRQRVRSGRFVVTTDRAFSDVIRACAEPRPAPAGVDDAVDGSWIDGRIIAMYGALHRAGHAHSVEAWLDSGGGPVLVGGLYGVHLGGLFAGESMFSRPGLGGTDASKVCLVHLWHHLRARGFTLLDTQFTTPHLERLGAVEIDREAYQARLMAAMGVATVWEPFSPGAPAPPATSTR